MTTDPLGPDVTVVRELESGDFAKHTVPASIAILMLFHDDMNGGEVNARAWDMSV